MTRSIVGKRWEWIPWDRIKATKFQALTDIHSIEAGFGAIKALLKDGNV